MISPAPLLDYLDRLSARVPFRRRSVMIGWPTGSPYRDGNGQLRLDLFTAAPPPTLSDCARSLAESRHAPARAKCEATHDELRRTLPEITGRIPKWTTV